MHVWMGWSYRMGRMMAAPMFPRERKDARNAQKMMTPLIWSGSVKKLEYVPMYSPSSRRRVAESARQKKHEKCITGDLFIFLNFRVGAVVPKTPKDGEASTKSL